MEMNPIEPGSTTAAPVPMPDPAERIRALEAERDTVRKELAEIRFQSRVRSLAEEHGFTDPDYLGYLFDRRSIAPEDTAGAAALLEELRQRSPRMFRARIHAGAADPAPAAEPEKPVSHAADFLIRQLEQAPELGFYP
ncbi:MAG: hypothetical protein J6R85_05215 [Lentisphaeria bacterium]|nr:hypothetical protein [Lentisphaeria bacterium]